MCNKTVNVGVNVTLRRTHATIFAVGKAVNITYSKCVSLALVKQHAICMHHIVNIVTCDLSGSKIFSTLLHKGHEFRKNL